jgi:hypothetical protein
MSAPDWTPRASVLHEEDARARQPWAVRHGFGFDPMHLCTYTAVAILAWLLTPSLVVVMMSSLGLVAYARALRAGIDHTSCRLRSPRMVIAYLAVAWLAGAWFTVAGVVGLLG